MKMLLSFILLSLFSYWSIHAKPFFEIKYSDDVAEATCNGTTTWTKWHDLFKSDTMIALYLSMKMNELEGCKEPLGMHVQLQSTPLEMNFHFDFKQYKAIMELLGIYRTFILDSKISQALVPVPKYRLSSCCPYVEFSETTDSIPLENYTCALSNTNNLNSSLVAYNEVHSDRMCTGVMLDARHVLIHASCVNQTNRTLNMILHLNNASRIHIDTIIIHPEYNSISQKNSLAIVKLANETEMPVAICLPFAGFVRGNNQTAIVLGPNYSKPNNPYEFDEEEMEILKDCPGIDQDHEFCVLEPADISSSVDRTLDSMIFDVQGTQKVLTGISFRRRIMASNGFAYVFSRVEPYVSWILSVIKKN